MMMTTLPFCFCFGCGGQLPLWYLQPAGPRNARSARPEFDQAGRSRRIRAFLSYHRAMPEPLPTTLLEDAIDIPVWLEADASTSLRRRMQRDREIARQLDVADEALRVRRWWQRIDKGGEALPGHRLAHARSWVNLALAIFGFVGGSGLALAAFRYDGTYPVNVVRLLGLLVAPQLILLVLNLLLIPGRLPGLRFIQDGLSAINPGALAAAVFRQLTHRPEARVFSWAAARTTAARRFGKWQMLCWSQMTAVAFNLGVIGTAAVLIAFTDLAFGWSTTLDVGSGTAARIVDTIAAPWAAIFPGAVPDQALVERSQFFRLEGPGSLPDSRSLAGWWAFTVLSVVVYGFIPRLAFLIVASARLHAATRALLLRDSRVAALLDRMAAPDVETRGMPQVASSGDAPPAAGGLPLAEPRGAASAVIWGQALPGDSAAGFARARLGYSLGQVFEAGSGSLDADLAVAERLAETAGNAGATDTADSDAAGTAVVVLTPAWEPPLLEFVDFLVALRRAIGPSRSIVVVPVGESMQAVTPAESENWRLAVGSAGDPQAYVETGDSGAGVEA
jgi:hypothetical protein